MSVCVYSVFVLSCVVATLRLADPPSKESYPLSIRLIFSELILNGKRSDSLIRPTRRRKKYNVKLVLCLIN
jgi:hypothetical protein